MRLAIAIPFKLSLNLHELPCYPPVKKGKEINEYTCINLSKFEKDGAVTFLLCLGRTTSRTKPSVADQK